MIKLLLDKQIFASSDAIMAATRKILSTTCTILALTWFCHVSIYIHSKMKVGANSKMKAGDNLVLTWRFSNSYGIGLIQLIH